jgi:hypothetical protein
MAHTIIPARDVGRVIFEDLREAARQEHPELSEAEREVLLTEFLDALSLKMFGGH